MALAHGAAHAYRHRAVVAHVAHRAKAYVKKTFTRKTTRKVTAKKHDTPDIGVGAEFTKMSISFGKPVTEKLPKLLQASIKTQTARLTLVNQFDNAASATTQPGVLGLNNFQLNGAGSIAQPLHLIDVTAWLNTVGGVIQYATPLYAMYIDPSGNVGFAENSAVYQLEMAADRSQDTAMYTRESDLVKTVKTRLLFYGCTAKPTRFDLDLISINDDSLQPDVSAPVNANASENVNYVGARNAFWNAMVRPYLWSPLMIGDTKAMSGKKYKVHQHSSFLLQEKLSNEPSSFAGHMKQVDYSMHLNRIQRYDWNNKNPTWGANSSMASELNDLASVASPKRRLYLMIRAQSTFNNGATVDPSKNPSYDLLLRSTHQSLV